MTAAHQTSENSERKVRIVIAPLDTVTDRDAVVFCEARRYAEEYGLCPPGGILARGEHGKPYFSGGGPEFSISHSGGYWVLALSEGPVGVDLQKVQACKSEAIARRHFHPQEYAWLQAEGFRRFFDLWAARESYVKYTGSGIAHGFNDLLITEAGPGRFEADGAVIYLLPFLNNYSLCVCTGYPAECEIFTI